MFFVVDFSAYLRALLDYANS